MQKVITRYAPSPTGNPHVGNIRTAIFAYLWARHNKGKFLLRIEDTDRERLVPESVKSIEESLRWIGLDYDDEMIFQSERREIHHKYAEQLLREGKAYKCFCTKERLEKLREEQTRKKLPPGYDKHCRNLSTEEVAELEKEQKYVIRFKMPETGRAEWNDRIRGKVSIEFALSDDPVIIKSDGWPTYHLASVIDDHEAEVSDVIRGEEWISSTPKHIALYQAFGWELPAFSHLPQINGTDGRKLSKRHGDTALLDYVGKGYLPEAMLNFLSILGWNDGSEKEFFTKDELIQSFDINRIGKSPSIFDPEKLNWMNGHYIRSLEDKELSARIRQLLSDNEIIKSGRFDRILEVEKSRLSTLCDITDGSDFYLNKPSYDPKLLIFKKSNLDDTRRGLESVLKYFEAKDWPDSVEGLSAALSTVVEETNLTNGDVFWPVRVSISGAERSASPAELLWVLGREESVSRIENALNKLK